METVSIDLERLRCFLAVAEERHFRRAAERLDRTQPPVSMAVKKLEESLGVQLLERSTRSVSLTPAGLALQEKGAALMEQVARTARHVQRVGNGLEGTIAMGFVGVAMTLGLPALIAQFHDQVPDVSLELDELPSQALVQRLLNGQIDLATPVRPVPEPQPLGAAPTGRLGFCAGRICRVGPEVGLTAARQVGRPFWAAPQPPRPPGGHGHLDLRDGPRTATRSTAHLRATL